MFYVYTLQSMEHSEQIYTGFTEILKERIEDHNSWKSPHTNKFRPWKIVHYSSFIDKKLALDFESYLKTSSGIAFRNKRLLKK